MMFIDTQMRVNVCGIFFLSCILAATLCLEDVLAQAEFVNESETLSFVG